MADDKGVGEGEKKDTTATAATTSAAVAKKKRKGIISRIWNGIFRLRDDDFEKRLQYISNEEVAVLGRMKRRSQTCRRIIRHLIMFSIIFEVAAVGYAVMTTRSTDLNWKTRAIRVSPMFLLPLVSSLAYYGFVNFLKMCDRKDQKNLERLRAERQAKINELKEKTNYYTTQQLIQRYDPDPAAKAAAASVLASKLGADSGLKVYVGDESMVDAPTGKSNDVEVAQSGGLRNRKQQHTSNSAGSTQLHHSSEGSPHSLGGECPQGEVPQSSEHNQLVVNHYPQGSSTQDGGWIARIAALLVGEDPTQSYALICGNCHMHNGLVRKEDFLFITYYCPHCHALNRPAGYEEHVSGSNTPPNSGSLKRGSSVDATSSTIGSASDSVVTSNSSIRDGAEIQEVTERAPSAADLVS